MDERTKDEKIIPFSLSRLSSLVLSFLLFLSSPAFADTPPKTEEQLKEIVRFEPSNWNAHFELANLYVMQHDSYRNQGDDDLANAKLQQARLALEQVTMFNPGFIPGHFNLGVIYKKQEKYAEAREQFKKVRELAPEDINALMQIGMTYEDQGFYEEARSVYLEAKEMQPYNPDIQNALVELERNQENDRVENLNTPLLPGTSLFQNNLVPQTGLTAQQQQGSGIGQATPLLAQMLLQSLMKKKTDQ